MPTVFIRDIVIAGAEERQEPTRHIVYDIQCTSPLGQWHVYRRYSEFVKLDEELRRRGGFQIPVALPPKTLGLAHLGAFFGWSGGPRKAEAEESDRLPRLAGYLRALLAHYGGTDESFWLFAPMKAFLNLRHGDETADVQLSDDGGMAAGNPFRADGGSRSPRNSDTSSPKRQSSSPAKQDTLPKISSQQWPEEYRKAERWLVDLRQRARRATSTSMTAEAQRSQAALMLQLRQHLRRLDVSLQRRAPTSTTSTDGTTLTERERGRRRTLLATLTKEYEALQQRARQPIPRNTSAPSARRRSGHDTRTPAHRSSTPSRSGPPAAGPSRTREALLGQGVATGTHAARASSGRVFGASATPPMPDARALVHGKSDQHVLQLQRDMMQAQDDSLERLHALVSRQKTMGHAIGDELDLQNKMLDDLDRQMDHTGAKLKSTDKQLRKLQ